MHRLKMQARRTVCLLTAIPIQNTRAHRTMMTMITSQTILSSKVNTTRHLGSFLCLTVSSAQDDALAEAIANGEVDSNYDDVLSEAHETYDEREARELEEIYAEEAEQMLRQAEEAEQRAAQSRAQMRENFEQRQREKEAVAERKVRGNIYGDQVNRI